MPFSEQNFFRTLAENSPDVICCVGLDSVLRYASPSSTRILGWRPEQLVGTGPEFLVHTEDLPMLQASARENLSNSNGAPPVIVRVRRPSGDYRWIQMDATPVRDRETGQPLQMVLVMRDVSEQKRREQQLQALALTDGLTGLLNRRGFDGELQEMWDATVRAGTQMSLLLLDIDHFKAFNDLYGHQMGDDCLRAVSSAVLKSLLCTTDRAARYGGEELVVILPDADAASAMRTAERIRSAIAALQLPHTGCSGSGGFLSVSIGVATVVARHGGSMRMPEALLQSADTALYKAKREGRNRSAGSLVMASPGN